MSVTTQRKRIANMVPLSGSTGFEVPPAAIGSDFESDVFLLEADISFINESDRTISGLMYTDAGVRAEAAGYDGVIINTFGDYGIRELRSLLGIPVVGAGQAALQLGNSLADRFGILTVWPKVTATTYRRLIDAYGVGRNCLGVRHVAKNEELPGMWEENGLVTDMRTLREAALDRLERGGQDLLEQGAELIVLGCSCMSPAAEELQRRLGCPVIDPLAAAHKSAELLVSLGLSQPRPLVPSSLSGLIPALFGGEVSVSPGEDADLCGDTCAVIGEPETALT